MMVDLSIHDVSGVVGWCLGAYSEVEKTCVHHLHTFLHTGSGLYNPLQHPRIVSRPHILYNISTTLYNTLQSTALQHFYSLQPLQPLQHPSGFQVSEALSSLNHLHVPEIHQHLNHGHISYVLHRHESPNGVWVWAKRSK